MPLSGCTTLSSRGPLLARLLRDVADDDEAVWQDLGGGRANAEQAWRATTIH
jgi:hypothetical protein